VPIERDQGGRKRSTAGSRVWHYNYFRSYSAERGRYTQADPIGLEGGFNRFGYVEGDALGSSDPMGLYTVVEQGFPAEEAALRDLGKALQLRIKELCPAAQQKLQPLFNKWVVKVDPRLRELQRNRSDYALTDF